MEKLLGKLVSNLSVINKLTEGVSKDVFERRASTGSGLLAFLNSGFAQTFRQIVCKGVKTLNNPNLVASRHYDRKGPLPVRGPTSGQRAPLKNAFA